MVCISSKFPFVFKYSGLEIRSISTFSTRSRDKSGKGSVATLNRSSNRRDIGEPFRCFDVSSYKVLCHYVQSFWRKWRTQLEKEKRVVNESHEGANNTKIRTKTFSFAPCILPPNFKSLQPML